MNKNTRPRQHALLALGITMCLVGALLMVNGRIFGDRTTSLANVTGIIGIGFITTYNSTLRLKPFKTANGGR